MQDLSRVANFQEGQIEFCSQCFHGAFIPALAAFITLGILVWRFGRFRPSKQDPYAGRLLKRPKLRRKKLSFRN
jgi:hypothetical protein